MSKTPRPLFYPTAAPQPYDKIMAHLNRLHVKKMTIATTGSSLILISYFFRCIRNSNSGIHIALVWLLCPLMEKKDTFSLLIIKGNNQFIK